MNQAVSNASYFKYWRLCAATGPVFLAAFIFFWGVLGYNIPPIPADFTAEQMAQHFRTHANEVRAGMVGAMLFGVLYLPWTLSITKVMEHIETDGNHMMSTLQMWGGGVTVVPLVTSSMFWLAGAYRLLFGTRHLDILAARNDDERGRMLVLMAKEGFGDGQ